MSFQAYLDSIREKTGKSPEDFAALARDLGLASHGEIVSWLKRDFELGHGHANAMAAVLLKSGARKATPDDRLAALFSGTKASWRPVCDSILSQVQAFGPDVAIGVGDVPPEGRLEAAGRWNAMVTHRVRIAVPAEVDGEVLGWLRRAYDAA